MINQRGISPIPPPPPPKSYRDCTKLPTTFSDTRRVKPTFQEVSGINRPATYQVGKGPTAQKFGTFKRQRLRHTQHYRRPSREERIASVRPWRLIPPPPVILQPPGQSGTTQRPPSRLPSRNLHCHGVGQQSFMGGNSSSIGERFTPSEREKTRPVSPLTGDRGPIMPAPLPELFLERETNSINGLTFRKRVSRMQLKEESNTNVQENQGFHYKGPNQVYQGPNSQSAITQGHRIPPQALNFGNHQQTIATRPEGPASMVWSDSAFLQRSEEFKETQSKGIISLVPPPNSLPPMYGGRRTLVFPFQDSPHSIHESRSITNITQLKTLPPPLPVSLPHAQPILPAPQSKSGPTTGGGSHLILVTYPPLNQPPKNFDSSTGPSINPSNIPSKLFSCPLFNQAPNLIQSQSQPLTLPSPKGGDSNREAAFGNPAVPNEIQDDLLRIEMLLELRKYKRALTAQLQAQQRLVQMCGSGSSQNLHCNNQPETQPEIQNPEHKALLQSQSLHTLLNGIQEFRHRQNHSEKRKYLMDIFKILSESLNGDEKPAPLQENPPEGGGEQVKPSPQQAKLEEEISPLPQPLPEQEKNSKTNTVWERELVKQLTSSGFMRTYMEPHINTIAEAGPGSNEVETNFQKNVNLLRGVVNTADFDTMEKSRSGFPSGLTLDLNKSIVNHTPINFPPVQNPLVAGANIAQALMHGKSDPNSGGVQNRTLQLVPTTPSLQRQYQHYHALDDPDMFPERMHTLSPNTLKVLEAKRSSNHPMPSFLSDNPEAHSSEGGNLFEMMRKPVQVRSPTSSQITPEGTPINIPQSAEPKLPKFPPDSDSVAPLEEKPSPFFPGFLGDIEMRIKTPEEKGAMQLNRKAASSSGVPAAKVATKFKEKNLSGSNIGDMEELGNLLKKLPVLSRKQKVEEFTFNTLKPASPVPEGESETSMIPMVSSQGTVATGTSRAASSSGRPETNTDLDGLVTETEDEMKGLDTAKMSISELVTLGRKIYRILSQLNTTPNRNAPSQVIASPVMLNLPPADTTAFATSLLNNNGRKNKGMSRSQTNNSLVPTNVLIDFNSIPNPTFVTGPGIVQTKSQHKGDNFPAFVRRTPLKTPNLFKKIVQPPPTRWGGKATGVMENQNSTSNPHRRSLSSFSSTAQRSRPSKQNIKIGVEETNYVPAGNKHSTNFPVVNRFSNNHRGDSTKEPPRFRRRRLETPPPPYYDQQLDTQASTTTNTTWGRSRSGTKRNFIQENISRVKNMKKLPESKVLPKPLPPVKKRYESIPSTIQSRSRSRSVSARREDEPQRRSSSVPVTPAEKGLHRKTFGRVGTAQSSRPSTVSLGTSRSRSPSRVASATGLRSTRTRILPKVERQAPVGGGAGAPKKFGTNPSYTSRAIGRVSGTSVVLRKSRSKTRRVGSAVPSLRSSSTSSGENQVIRKTMPPPQLPQAHMQRRVRSRPGLGEVKRGRKRHVKSKVGEKRVEVVIPTEGGKYEEVLNSDSDQTLIRNMVKAEMDEILQRHMSSLLQRTKPEPEVKKPKPLQLPAQQHLQLMNPPLVQKSKPKVYEASADSDSSSIIASGNLTPIYTPPKVYDESLFSLEKWINPEGHTIPMTPYTSAKDTPGTTPNFGANGMSLGAGTGQSMNMNLGPAGRKQSKLQTVRFSLPQSTPTK